MPPGFFAERRTGELVSRLTTDIGLLQGVLSHQIAEFSRQMLALVGGIILLTVMQPRLTLTALAVVPLAVGSALFFGRRLRRMTTPCRTRLPTPRPGRRSVQPDPDGPELRAGARRTAALCRTDRRECPGGAVTSPDPGRLLRRVHLRHLRRHRHRAVAGRAAGARGPAHSGRAGPVPSLYHHHRGGYRRTRIVLQQLPGSGGAAQRVFEILETEP